MMRALTNHALFYCRLQNGKNPRKTDIDGDRVINTQNDGNTKNKAYGTPNDSDIRGTTSKDDSKVIGHIHLEPK